MQAVYGVLKEAEHRSTFYIPYWNIPITRYIVPRQRKFRADLEVINDCLDGLIARAKQTRQADDVEALQARDYSKVPIDLRASFAQLATASMTMMLTSVLDPHEGCSSYRVRSSLQARLTSWRVDSGPLSFVHRPGCIRTSCQHAVKWQKSICIFEMTLCLQVVLDCTCEPFMLYCRSLIHPCCASWWT